MTQKIDARGLSCPEPVLRARQAIQGLEPGGSVQVEVDAGVARENVCRMAASMGCRVESEPVAGGALVTITKQ